ncbi:helix-turn-helix domain-containing protein [Ensifer sp. WSM1721]|uniref:helix-turn-helix domain-containing protein n=1 Tax=Ensifer sp. WSM1721 TaxID=1041159 RepID=UPI00047CB965|nr:helix-turn-helix transcriptional regulator [Ensifer sp. WSM1721]
MLSRRPEGTKRKPEPVDIHVGRRIRLRRAWKEMTQSSLADAIGVTFQQVQKYEKGTNRVGASRLQLMANALDVPISYFFEDSPGAVTSEGDKNSATTGLQPELLEFVSSDEGVALISSFSRITDEKVRRRTISLVKALAEGH